MVEPQPSKLTTWVRFPSSAPFETLKAISSTHPYKIQITSGKINVLESTNIETIIPIRYLLFYRTKIIEFYEYPEDLVKGNNFINLQTKQTFNKNELKTYISNY